MWEIFAYGNVDVLTQIFNGAAMLMNSDDYLSLIKVVTLVAFLAVFIGALSHERFGGFKWFISALVMYMLLFVPKTQVMLTDRLALSGPQIVDNVPLGMAVFGHITSKTGDWLARSFDSVFTIPGTTKYTASGMLFANRIIERTRFFEPLNQRLGTNIHTFIRACTYYDIAQGNVDANTLRNAPIGTGVDAWAIMGATTNAGRLTNYINSANVTSTVNCRDGWGLIDADITAVTGTWFEKLGGFMHPQMTTAAAAAAVQTEMVDVYGTMLTVGATAPEIIRQNFIINTVLSNGALTASELNDTSSTMLNFATAQAEATAKLNAGTSANLAKQAMPMIRNAVEVIIYAVFPLTFLLTLMPVVTALNALKGFVMGLMWVQLWAPLYAVLNMLATVKTASDLGGVALGSNLTLNTAMDIQATVLSNTDVAGSMVIAIPIIAAALVKGGEMLLTGATGAATQPMAAAAAGAAGQVALGNTSLGVTNFDTRSAHNVAEGNLTRNNRSWNNDTHDNKQGNKWDESVGRVDSSMITKSNELGTHQTGTSGYQTFNAKQSSLPAQSQVDLQAATAFEKRSARSTDAAFKNVMNTAHSINHDQQSGLAYDTKRGIADKKLAAVREAIQNQYQEQTGKKLTTSEADTIAYGASGNLGLSFKAGGGVEASVGHRNSDSIDMLKLRQAANSALKEQGITNALEYVKTMTETRQFSDAIRSGNSAATQTSVDLTEAVKFSEMSKDSLSAAASTKINTTNAQLNELGKEGAERMVLANARGDYPVAAFIAQNQRVIAGVGGDMSNAASISGMNPGVSGAGDVRAQHGNDIGRYGEAADRNGVGPHNAPRVDSGVRSDVQREIDSERSKQLQDGAPSGVGVVSSTVRAEQDRAFGEDGKGGESAGLGKEVDQSNVGEMKNGLFLDRIKASMKNGGSNDDSDDDNPAHRN